MTKVARRILALAGIAMALAACSSSGKSINEGLSGVGANVGGGGGGVTGGGGAAGNPNEVVLQFNQQINRNVDILFVIDTSPSIGALQDKLIQSFPQFFDTLMSLPGGLPDVHIAVVSSNMGAGANDETAVPGCPIFGDKGLFQAKPNGPTCATATLNPGQNFIVNVGGAANYTGTLPDMLACIAQLGEGCGFTQPLGSMLRALGADGQPAPMANAEFLRSDAFLSVILLADEDDCSAPPNTNLYDPSSQLVSDPLGPLSSYRCVEFGLTCGGKKPPRTSAADLTGMCVSAEDGVLLRVSDVVRQLKTLKSDPSKVMVEAIAGPPNPFEVQLDPPGIATDPNQWPAVAPSCTAADGTFALPAVRLSEWASAFGGGGVFEDGCATDFGAALTAAATQIAKAIGEPCLDASFDPSRCAVVAHAFDAEGNIVDTALPQCQGLPSATSCWTVQPGTAGKCPGAQAFTFNFPAGAPITQFVTATCQK